RAHQRRGDTAARQTPSGARQTGPASRRPAEGPGCCTEGWSPKTESGLQACYGKAPLSGAFLSRRFADDGSGPPVAGPTANSVDPLGAGAQTLPDVAPHHV